MNSRNRDSQQTVPVLGQVPHNRSTDDVPKVLRDDDRLPTAFLIISAESLVFAFGGGLV